MTTSDYINLFNNQYEYLLNFCQTCGVTKEEGEDIVFHSFHVFWIRKEMIHIHSANTYLFTLAKNKCIDTVRRKNTRKRVYGQLLNTPNHIDPIRDIDLKHIAAHVYDIIHSLPPKQKEYITMRYLNDIPIKDIIEERNDINRNTFRNTLVQATNNIIKELKNRGITLG